MNIKQASKTLVKRLLESRGYVIYNLQAHRARMESGIEGLSKRNHTINTVVDVGASDGRWSSMFMKTYPMCNYLLVEAQPTHREAIEQFCRTQKNAQFVLAAAGDAVGQVNFDVSDAFVGQAVRLQSSSKNIIVPMTTIDYEIQARGLPGPYLIKLDTHGFEVPILKGAQDVLGKTEVIIMECYNFRISPECLLFFEMCQHLGKSGFRCIDLVDPRHRPYDNAFWQMDLVFIKDDSLEFSHSEYY
jgi:FkbM family methyltransferase